MITSCIILVKLSLIFRVLPTQDLIDYLDPMNKQDRESVITSMFQIIKRGSRSSHST